MELQKSTLSIISVVAIVAIVGVVALFLSKSGSLGSDDLAGQATMSTQQQQAYQQCSSTCTGTNTAIKQCRRQCQNQAMLGTVQAAQCIDSDGGRDYSVIGTTSFGGVTKVDYCIDLNMLGEYYCDNNNGRLERYTCPNGCSNGVCNAPNPCATITCPAQCSGNNIQRGACNPVTGQCDYTTAYTCANGCNAGVCTKVAAVNQCAGVTCSYGGTCLNGNCQCQGMGYICQGNVRKQIGVACNVMSQETCANGCSVGRCNLVGSTLSTPINCDTPPCEYTIINDNVLHTYEVQVDQFLGAYSGFRLKYLGIGAAQTVAMFSYTFGNGNTTSEFRSLNLETNRPRQNLNNNLFIELITINSQDGSVTFRVGIVTP